MGLEQILSQFYGCKKPFLKKKQLAGTYSDGGKVYNYMTRSGIKAYEKLVKTVYALEEIGVTSNVNEIVNALDEIVSQEQ